MKNNTYLASLLFAFYCTLTPLLATGMMQYAEVGLATLNFSLGTAVAHLDIETPEGQELLLKLQSAREATRCMIDILAIKNHYNYYTAPLWLIKDFLNTTKLITSDKEKYYEKPAFELYGLWDALESITVICAALAHDSSQGLAMRQRNAIILQSISSLARLHNQQSPNKLLISLNTLFISILCIYKKIMFSINGENEPYKSVYDQINEYQNSHRPQQYSKSHPNDNNHNTSTDQATPAPILFKSFSCAEGSSTPQDHTMRVEYNANTIPVERHVPSSSFFGIELEESTIAMNQHEITITRVDNEGNEQVATTHLNPRNDPTTSMDVLCNTHYVITPCNHIQKSYSLCSRNNRYRNRDRTEICTTCYQTISNNDELRYIFLPKNQESGSLPTYRYTDNIEKAFQRQSRQAHGYDQTTS